MGYFDSLRPPARSTPPLAVVPEVQTGEATSYAAAALRRECAELAAVGEGQRNAELNKSALRMGRHIGAGNIDQATVIAALTDAALSIGLSRHEIDKTLRPDRADSGLQIGMASPRHPAPLAAVPAVTVLDLEPASEDAFWDARPILRHLHDFARARRVSPWAVLGVTLARVITATPPAVCLPPIVGGKASLNLFVGLVGPSGSGKGAAEAVAADALHVGAITSHNVGSGEGIAHGYKQRVKGNLEWVDPNNRAVLFSVPEIDSLAAQGDRKGATLMPQLRSGWTGEQLGFGYADPAKRIIVEAHEYRLCLIAGIQPGRAGCLLDDADGGTPQRFLWLPATDRSAPDVPPLEPSPLSWRPPQPGVSFGVIGGLKVDVCALARDTITTNRLARLRGEGDALDGHALLAQLKTAAAIGIMDGRYSVTDDDWALADIIARKSAATRNGVAETLRAKAGEANHGRAEAEAGRAVLVAERLEDAAVKRVCGVIVRKLKRVDDWVSRRTLRDAASRDRAHLDDALHRLIDAATIEVQDTEKGPRYRLRKETP